MLFFVLNYIIFSIKKTPYYIAPEILRNSYNEKCDIWSLGIMTHLMLTKTLPFDADKIEEMF